MQNKPELCVSVSGSTIQECVAALKGATFAELRLDLVTANADEISKIMSYCPRWIVAIRRSFLSKPQAPALFASAMNNRPNYVDFDAELINWPDIQQYIEKAKQLHTTIIFSYHNYSCTPSDSELLEIIRNLFAKGANMVKIACMANSIADAKRLTKLYRHFDNLIAFGMGTYGRFSRIASCFLGPCICYVAPDRGKETAPGQIPLSKMKQILEKECMSVMPGRINGQMVAPASKSELQRALFLAMLSKGTSKLTGCTISDDVNAAIDIIRQFGTHVTGSSEITIVPPASQQCSPVVVNAAESALALRMIAPIASVTGRITEINAQKTLLNRPLQPLFEMLEAAGIPFETKLGKLPLTILGPPQNKHITIDGSFSSQMLSGMLIAFPLLPHNTIIDVIQPVSIPYIELTLEMIKTFGVNIQHENFSRFYITGNQTYQGTTIHIGGDWSGASNFLVAAAISGEITIQGLNIRSKQADKAILNVIRDFGANIYCDEIAIKVSKNQCHPFTFDATHCPDLVPPLAILAVAAHGKSIIRGIHRLIHKESNRIESVAEMLEALGVDIEIMEDCMTIHGNGIVRGGVVHSRGDHRIAMASATAAGIAQNPVHIVDANVVSKSFPQFFEFMKFN